MTPAAPPRSRYTDPSPLLVVRGNGQLVFSSPEAQEIVAEFAELDDAIAAWKAASDALRNLKILLRYG